MKVKTRTLSFHSMVYTQSAMGRLIYTSNCLIRSLRSILLNNGIRSVKQFQFSGSNIVVWPVSHWLDLGFESPGARWGSTEVRRRTSVARVRRRRRRLAHCHFQSERLILMLRLGREQPFRLHVFWKGMFRGWRLLAFTPGYKRSGLLAWEAVIAPFQGLG
jgi:hypothetical protein